MSNTTNLNETIAALQELVCSPQVLGVLVYPNSDGEGFSAHCLDIGYLVPGDTEREAREAMLESLPVMLDSAIEDGVLRALLAENRHAYPEHRREFKTRMTADEARLHILRVPAMGDGKEQDLRAWLAVGWISVKSKPVTD